MQDVTIRPRGVGIASLHGQADCFEWGHSPCDADDSKGKDQAHSEDGDEDSDGEEHALPPRTQFAKILGIHGSIVEGEHNFYDDEDRR